jgi:hypothetical protein
MEVSNRKINLFSYIYKQNYNRVLHCLRDIRKTNEICNTLDSNYASELIFSKGNETWQVGAEFSFVWKKLIKMFFRTVEYTETSDFSKVRWIVYKTEPHTLEYYLTYFLYQDITGNYNTMVMEWEYYVEFNVSQSDQDTKKRENISIYSAIDKYLSQEENKTLQEECIYIESDLNIIWKIISNFKIFQRLVPIICKSVVYSGDIISGTKVTMFFDCKNKAYVVMNIKSIIVRESLCRLTYECFEGNPPVPKQEIVWTVEEKEGGFCLVSFRHYYEEVLKQDSLIQTSKLKKKILQTLKLIVERDYEENTSDNISFKDSVILESETNSDSQII